uniref:Uncharacterized protein n=1 Tax=Anopheles darlingi TaxID=43151 RepID=A0A2M4D3E5_ANODA
MEFVIPKHMLHYHGTYTCETLLTVLLIGVFSCWGFPANTTDICIRCQYLGLNGCSHIMCTLIFAPSILHSFWLLHSKWLYDSIESLEQFNKLMKYFDFTHVAASGGFGHTV